MIKNKSALLVLAAIALSFAVGTQINKQPKTVEEIPVSTTTTTVTTTTTRPPMYELTGDEITAAAKQFNVSEEAVLEATTYKRLYIVNVQLAPVAESLVWNPGELSESQMMGIERVTTDDGTAYRYIKRILLLTPKELTEVQMQEITSKVEMDANESYWPYEVKFVTDYYNTNGELQCANYFLMLSGIDDEGKWFSEFGYTTEMLLVDDWIRETGIGYDSIMGCLVN